MEGDRERWDARHAGAESPEPAMPVGLDPLLVPAGGLCLDVACGRGAESVWAALAGFDVVALDVSPEAVRRTAELAAVHGVADRVDARVHDLDHGLPGELRAACDLVVCQRFRDARIYPHLLDALGADGVLVVTVLSMVGGAAAPGRFVAVPGELAVAFAGLPARIVSHHERAGVATLVARHAER